MTDLPPPETIDLFDEAGYLRRSPGIAEAMVRGIVDTPWNHYAAYGRDEGRPPNDVDPDFYLARYPEAAADLGRPPSPDDAALHYIALGRARGYLPNAAAPRPAGGGATWSPFGGFWTDRADALDAIVGRLDLGRIAPRQARFLRTFALDGIEKIEPAVAEDQLEAARLAVDQIFTGLFPEALFDHAPPGQGAEPWRPELTERNLAALDPHMMSEAIRALLLDETVREALCAIFDAPPKLTHSRAFPRQSTGPDRDVAWFGHTRPLQCAAVTFALETEQTGAAYAWTGTHRLPDLLWPGGHVALSEARRTGAPGLAEALARRPDQVGAAISGRVRLGLDTAPGSRFLRHANLVHSVHAPRSPAVQRSVTAWYCPSYVSPCFSGPAPGRTHARDGFVFCSTAYTDMEPRA